MKKFFNKVKQSPINYYSDLFIVVMVIAWACAIPFVGIFAVYSTITMENIGLWANFVELITVPLTAGGAIWMIKNSIQHALASKRGETCEPDFAAVHPDNEEEEIEKEKIYKYKAD